MRRLLQVSIVLAAALTLPLVGHFVAFAVAEDPGNPDPAATESAASKPTATIGELVRQLDDAQFAAREAATQALESFGENAVKPLLRVAERGSAEASRRAFALLEKFATSSDAALRETVRAGLKRISESKNTQVAERASQLLANVIPQAAQPGQGQPRQGGPGIRLEVFPRVHRGGKAGGIPRGGSSRTVVRQNGRTEITVKEHGRTVKIVEAPNNGGITMEVTEQQLAGDGQADQGAEAKQEAKVVTKTYAAKDAADLKAKHPEAHRIYEQIVAQTNAPAGRIPRGIFPPGWGPGDDAFRGFDDDFFRRFDELLPPDLREARPGFPRRNFEADVEEELRRVEEQFRRLQQRMLERRRRGFQRDDRQPRKEREEVDQRDEAGEDAGPGNKKPEPKSIDKKRLIEA